MILPSKELLSEVLEVVCTDVKFDNYSNDVIYEAFGEGSINIYEFAYKCKEWSFKQDYFILESAYVPNGEFTSSYCKADQKFLRPTKKQTFNANTEPEAIFKACEWILKEMKI